MLTQSDLQKISSIVQTALLNHPTKADLRNHPTKADLSNHPTKADMLKYATKDDLKNELKKALTDYPKRDEMNVTLNNALNSSLKGYVTKKEFKKESRVVQRKLNVIINFFDREYRSLENRVQKLEYNILK